MQNAVREAYTSSLRYMLLPSLHVPVPCDGARSYTRACCMAWLHPYAHPLPLSCSSCTFARRRQKRLLALGFGRSKGVKPVTVSSSLLVGGTISERLTRYARGPLSMLTMHQPCPSLLKSTGLDRTWSRDPCPKCKGPALGIPIGTGSVIRQRGAMHG